MHFNVQVMYPVPAEPCFFRTKRRFINAILCYIAMTTLWRSDLGAASRGTHHTSFVFDSRRSFACDIYSTIGFVKIIE